MVITIMLTAYHGTVFYDYMKGMTQLLLGIIYPQVDQPEYA